MEIEMGSDVMSPGWEPECFSSLDLGDELQGEVVGFQSAEDSTGPFQVILLLDSTTGISTELAVRDYRLDRELARIRPQRGDIIRVMRLPESAGRGAFAVQVMSRASWSTAETATATPYGSLS